MENQRVTPDAEGDSSWCNCQAIPGTWNYPGPWHERAGEDHYPCAQNLGEVQSVVE